MTVELDLLIYGPALISVKWRNLSVFIRIFFIMCMLKGPLCLPEELAGLTVRQKKM